MQWKMPLFRKKILQKYQTRQLKNRKCSDSLKVVRGIGVNKVSTSGKLGSLFEKEVSLLFRDGIILYKVQNQLK